MSDKGAFDAAIWAPSAAGEKKGNSREEKRENAGEGEAALTEERRKLV